MCHALHDNRHTQCCLNRPFSVHARTSCDTCLFSFQAATLADKRIVVAIDGWEPDSAYPAGHYVRTLGPIGDRDTETEVLLLENDINTSPFTPAVHACVPPLPWSVTQGDIDDPNRWNSCP